MAERVKIEIQDNIAHVILNRPDKHNGVDPVMLRAVLKAQKVLKKNRDIRAVILRGEGPSLCAGLDFKTFLKQTSGFVSAYLSLWLPWMTGLQRWSMGWRSLPVPVIAVMHGNCFGAGIQLALGADIRISKPDAKLSFMEAKWGMVPDMGGIALIRELIPIDIAKELTMTGRVISAQDGKDYGLITHISDDPLAKAIELCEETMLYSPDAVGQGKRLVQGAWAQGDHAALYSERTVQRRLVGRKNNRIAIDNAFGKDKKPYLKRSM